MDHDLSNQPTEDARKAYAAPELIEHGDIHTLVHFNVGAGTDGGLIGLNAS